MIGGLSGNQYAALRKALNDAQATITAQSATLTAQAALIATNRATIRKAANWVGTLNSGTTIDIFSTGNTKIDTVDNSVPAESFYPMQIQIGVVARTGTPILTLVAFNIGTNSPNYNNIAVISSANILGLTTIGAYTPIAAGQGITNSVATPITAGTDIYVRVTGAATGIGASLTYYVNILGGYR